MPSKARRDTESSPTPACVWGRGQAALPAPHPQCLGGYHLCLQGWHFGRSGHPPFSQARLQLVQLQGDLGKASPSHSPALCTSEEATSPGSPALQAGLPSFSHAGQVLARAAPAVPARLTALTSAGRGVSQVTCSRSTHRHILSWAIEAKRELASGASSELQAGNSANGRELAGACSPGTELVFLT